MENNISLQLQEKDLELVVTEKTLGCLTTNAKNIKSIVEQSLKNYDISNYDSDNIEIAKKDKAMLNKASKALNAKRIEFEKEFMKPFDEFKSIVSETVKLITSCSSQIDSIVKQFEDNEKASKKQQIKDYFDSFDFNAVSFDRIFNIAWLNKTSKEKDWKLAIVNIITQIKSDLQSLDSLEDSDILKGIYLDKLDLGMAIQYGNTLKQNREKAKLAETEKVHLEEKAPEEVEHVVTHKNAECVSKAEVEILERAFKVQGTKEDIMALGDFMNSRGIKFEKLNL